MSKTYLFRIDMNKDNEMFFNARKSLASHVYGGIAIGIGSSSDWIPDLIEIDVDDLNNFKLRLIELEAQESSALISSRKYLPENSGQIVSKVGEYLEKVIRACRSSADPRESEFVELRQKLAEAENIYLTTAGALRATGAFIEELPLLGQPKTAVQHLSPQNVTQEEFLIFKGILKLNGDRAAALGRTILILDAVIRQQDHSDATFKAWRGQDNSQPLKKLLKKNSPAYPTLRAFIAEWKYGGTTLNFEEMISELAKIWSVTQKENASTEVVRNFINHYYPVGAAVQPNERMPSVFDRARKLLADMSI